MKFKRMLSNLMMLLFFAQSSQASEAPDLVGDREELVMRFMELATVNIGQAKLADGSLVGPELASELDLPVIPHEDGKRVVNRGFLTAMAEFCSLDWNTLSFVPFMASERLNRTWSDLQTSYIGLLHGISQGWFLKGLEERGNCTEDNREHTARLLKFAT
jgi:hypothetical protein